MYYCKYFYFLIHIQEHFMGIALQSLHAVIILTVHVFILDDIPYLVGTLTPFN